MKLRKLFVGLIACSLFFLGGCDKNEKSELENSGESVSQKLLIYSNAADDGRGDWIQEQAKEAGFDVEFVEMGANDLQNRVLAEKEGPIADMIIGLNQMNFNELKEEDLLVPYNPSWKDEIDSDIPIDKDGMFYPYSVQRVILVYNQDFVQEGDAPTSYADLYEKDRFKDKYSVANNLGGSTNNAAFYTQIVNFEDKKGNLGISEEGWAAIKDYYDNGYRASEGESATANMAEGKIPYMTTYLSNIPQLEDKFSITLGVVNPPYGVPQLVEQIGILNKGKSTDTAEKFADWYGSAEVQEAFAKKFSTMPANKKSMEGVSDRLKEIMDKTTPQDINYEFVGEHLQEWVEYIELNIL